MKAPAHLQAQMQAWFPADVLARLREAGAVAAELGYSLYLIGGSIRDLLLERDFVWDVDLVSETYGVHHLAQALQQRWGGTLQTFPRYGTAKLRLEPLELDFATARTEHYAHPGAKPDVSYSNLEEDLIRRDFTINAMAVGLQPQQFGALIDPFRGWQDLQDRALRTLHERKFLEDPVRCWRAARMAQMLGFEIEPWTAELIQAAMASGSFDYFFSARMRRELDKLFDKPEPLPYLRRLHQLEVLRCLDPRLDWPGLEARLAAVPASAGLFEAEVESVYLILLVEALSPAGHERVLPALELTRPQLQAWQSMHKILHIPDDWDELRPSQIYQRLEKLPPAAIWALLAAAGPALGRAVSDFWSATRFVRPAVSGTIIKEWLPPGPHIREILQRVLFARLDGLITTPEQEFALARELADRIDQGGQQPDRQVGE
ncbi:MAG TPA: hypothetical protein V6D23_24955 [Candidatus Obscuribacterales bacterium]